MDFAAADGVIVYPAVCMEQAGVVYGYYNVLANVAYLKQYLFVNQATSALGSVCLLLYGIAVTMYD